MSPTAGAVHRRGRPKLKKKSIVELERQLESNTAALNVDEELANNVDEIVTDQNEEESTESLEDENPKPVGRSIGSGEMLGQLYSAYQWLGNTYNLEDTVMVYAAEVEDSPRPLVAIIKSIRQAVNGEMYTTLRWLYRAEELNINDYPRCSTFDHRELFFTNHDEEVPAAMILYKCVVNFLTSDKQPPNRRVHHGFVVQHFYDHLKQRVFDTNQEAALRGSLRKEFFSRVRETELRIGYVPNIDNRDKVVYHKGLQNNETSVGENTSTYKKGLERPDEQLSKQRHKNKAPISYVKILSLYGVLRNDSRRDMYLARLLESIHSQWDFISSWHGDGLANIQVGGNLMWPDCVIGPIHSLESKANAAFEEDSQKYKQKMRQLVFNLKTNRVLAKRFVAQEIEPSTLLNMSPEELKAGLTAEELPKNDSDGKQEIQMVDIHCKNCSEEKVRLLEVIQAGMKQRYQVECSECGAIWFTYP